MIRSRFTPTVILEHSQSTPHYVKAIHDYLPTSIDNVDESVTSLYFRKGSIIEVFNKDESGWWDGQCGNDRGWFPSNYVSYDELTRQTSDLEIDYSTSENVNFWNQRMMRPCFNFPNVSHNNYTMKIATQSRTDMPLIKSEKRRSRGNSINKETPDITFSMEVATIRVNDLVGACNHPNQSDIQLYSTRIVSSIKSILVESNMINKNSYLLRICPELAYQRKAILIALNRLITKSKELQSAENLEREQIQVSKFANELMDTIKQLTKILTTIQRQPLSNITDSTIQGQRSSTLFDTPYSSISSLYYSTSGSCSNITLRQYLPETHHPSTSKNTYSLRVRPDYPTDKKELLKIVMSHQACIIDLIDKLKRSLEQYLENRSHATVILDITRKVMESVMNYLSAVEHVCSNISELDDSRRAFTIPKDPSHVSLIIKKESVYSTITNLVTAVRISTEPYRNSQKFDKEHLYSCCEGVITTTKECTLCINACLMEEQHLLHMQELSEKTHSQLPDNSNFSSTFIQQHINKQHFGISLPDLKPAEITLDKTVENKIDMINTQRLSIASSKESFQSSLSFSSLSVISTANSIVSTTDSILPDSTPVKGGKNASTISFSYSPPIPLNDHHPLTIPQDIIKAAPQHLRTRFSKGLSVSSLKSSFSKSKIERKSTEKISESIKLPSVMEVKPEKSSSSHTDIAAPFSSDQLEVSDKEPDYLILKKYAFKEQDIVVNSEGEVVGATAEALVQKLTLHEELSDPEFVRTFFYTFRLFSSPSQFLELLIERYHLQPPSHITETQSDLWTNHILIPIRLRVYEVMKIWLECYFVREQDSVVVDRLSSFISSDVNKLMPGPAKHLIELKKNGTDHLLSTLAKFNDSNESSFSQSILGKGLRSTFKKSAITHVNRIDSIELARQLTLMESHLFCQIQTNEMIGQKFKKKTSQSQALHVKAMIQKSTRITGWVSDTILKEKDIKKRSSVLKHWIKVGDACLQFNNYNTLMAIRSALDSASIIRLKKTWDCLSSKYKTMWETIHNATDSRRNFAEYRKRLRTASGPCLPFLGIYLTDMTFIDDGNPDCRTAPNGNQLINFNKYCKMAKILNEIHRFQIPYKFIEVEEVQRYIRDTLQKVEQDDQLFYQRSLKCEPKEEESS